MRCWCLQLTHNARSRCSCACLAEMPKYGMQPVQSALRDMRVAVAKALGLHDAAAAGGNGNI